MELYNSSILKTLVVQVILLRALMQDAYNSCVHWDKPCYLISVIDSAKKFINAIVECCWKINRYALGVRLYFALLPKFIIYDHDTESRKQVLIDRLNDLDDKSDEYKKVCQAILDHELFHAICNIAFEKNLKLRSGDIQQLNRRSYSKYDSSYLELIPKVFLDNQESYLRNRFKARGEQFSKHQVIDNKHPLYKSLTTFIKQLSQIYEHGCCLEYLSILDPTSRSTFVYSLLLRFLREREYYFARKCVSLYEENENGDVLKSFVNYL